MQPPGETPRDRDLVSSLLEAYAEGLFPMAEPESGQILWYDPDPRGILPLEAGRIRFSRSLRRRVRSGRFAVTCDLAYDAVVRSCAEPRGGSGPSWIDARIRRAYGAMHRAGHAHSIEAWLAPDPGGVPEAGPGAVLVGGLYGVHIGGLFAGESMFCRPGLGGTDASKVCLVHLVAHLRRIGCTLLDTQFRSAHLEQFGCVDVPRHVYRRRLERALRVPVRWGRFTPAPGDAE